MSNKYEGGISQEPQEGVELATVQTPQENDFDPAGVHGGRLIDGKVNEALKLGGKYVTTVEHGRGRRTHTVTLQDPETEAKYVISFEEFDDDKKDPMLKDLREFAVQDGFRPSSQFGRNRLRVSKHVGQFHRGFDRISSATEKTYLDELITGLHRAEAIEMPEEGDAQEIA